VTNKNQKRCATKGANAAATMLLQINNWLRLSTNSIGTLPAAHRIATFSAFNMFCVEAANSALEI